MSKQIKTLEQLRDSRLLFDRKFPPFGYFLILIISIFLAGVIVWSIYTPKAYMIIATGTVTNENSNYVMSSFTGEIVTTYMKEGLLVEKGDVLFTVKSTDYDLQEEQLTGNLEVYTTQKKQYEKLVQAIKENTNLFDASNPDDELFYNTFESYKAQVAQNEFDAGAYVAYGYTEEQIEAQMEINESKTTKVYYDAIVSAENAIAECEQQIASIDSQLSAISSGQGAYVVEASSSGVLHLLGDYKSGVVVQTASIVATITPENDNIITETYISTSDMARIHVGDHVDMAVSGLTQSVYGTISGTVTQIDSNSTSKNDSSGDEEPVFKVQIKPDYTYLVSKTGDKVDIRNGMTVEARIEYDKVTYFNYVMEKIGVLTR